MKLRVKRVAAGPVRNRQLCRKRLVLLHRDLALPGRSIRDQRVLLRAHTGRRLGAVVAGEYGSQILPEFALGRFAGQGKAQGIDAQLAELRRAAALHI